MRLTQHSSLLEWGSQNSTPMLWGFGAECLYYFFFFLHNAKLINIWAERVPNVLPSQAPQASLPEGYHYIMQWPRVLEQWQPFKLYFSNILLKERLTAVKKTDFLLTFSIVPHLNSVSVLFQWKGPTLHLLHDKFCSSYRLLLRSFCYSHIIAKPPLHDTHPSDQSNHKPDEQIYLGAGLHDIFQRPEHHRGDRI